ncbi:MAG: hypothetical protein GYA43_02705 [Bacteroidales bacterium]|nr:hypothetical protein [Bacteroidales bacterium]
MKTKLFTLLIASAFISFTACQKDSAPIDQDSVNLADDDAVTNVVFDDIFSTVDNASQMMEDVLGKGDAKGGEYVMTDSCPTVTVSSTSPDVWPKTITIDYGTGCTGFNGSTRAGKIIITVSARRNVLNATRTVTFDNYYFNGIKVEGTKEVKNLGPNDAQHVVFSVKVTDGKLTLPDGKTIERNVNHQREWIAGWFTRNIWDDECLITGTATGKTINGVAYTNTILTALHWKRVCEFFVSGVIKFEREGAEPVELDYGTGECDAVATLRRGDATKEITLRHRHRLMQP